MTIHSLFILNRAGVCLYSENFSHEFNFEVNLLTPFFSAIISFSKNYINRDLEELEFSGLRFIFEIKEEIVFVLLADLSDSILFISPRLKKIIEIFSHFYNISDDRFKDSRPLEDPELDKQINTIIRGDEDLIKSSNFYLKVIDFFNNLSIQDIILGGALLSLNGDLVFTNLPSEVLLGSIKELEIRFMTGALHLPELYYSLADGQKIFSKIIETRNRKAYYMVLYFDKSISLGLAHINLTKIAKQIEKLISIYI